MVSKRNENLAALFGSCFLKSHDQVKDLTIMGTPINEVSYLDKSGSSSGPLISRVDQFNPPQEGKELSQAAVDIRDRNDSVSRFWILAGLPRHLQKGGGKEGKR